MRCVQIATVGGGNVLELVELPDPCPGPGEALVRVEAAGVNFIDVYHRTGLYKLDLPARLGHEGAGEVVSVGDGAGTVSVGERVAWAGGQGSYATHVLVPVSRLVPIPDGVTSSTAAAVILQGMTAHYLACDTFRLGPGHTCIVHAAAGGVGLLLCQFARRAGARVFGTVSTKQKADLAMGAGAEAVFVHGEGNFLEEARRHTGGEGVDVVYDSIGKDTFDRSLSALKPRGMLVMYGQSSGAVPPFDILALSTRGSLFLTRPTLAHYTLTRKDLLRRAGAVFDAVLSGALAVRVHASLPLDRVREAHALLESRATAGKVMLLP